MAGGAKRRAAGEGLKDDFIRRFEEKILSGELKSGERIPPERVLASDFKVSRPVVHQGLVELAGKGLIRIESRVGSFVNDYRKEGSIELLLSMLHHDSGRLAPRLFDGILEMRLLFEVEAARLAAVRRHDEDLASLKRVVAKERLLEPGQPLEMAQIDFEFHMTVTAASGNEVYTLLINSFKRLYIAILSGFYQDWSVVSRVIELHETLVAAIEAGSEQRSSLTMGEILTYGESELRRMLAERSVGAEARGRSPDAP